MQILEPLQGNTFLQNKGMASKNLFWNKDLFKIVSKTYISILVDTRLTTNNFANLKEVLPHILVNGTAMPNEENKKPGGIVVLVQKDRVKNIIASKHFKPANQPHRVFAITFYDLLLKAKILVEGFY